MVSSTNIDRIFGLYHAAKEANRCFVCDDYQAGLLKIVSDNHKKHSSFYDIDYEQTKTHVGRFITLNRWNEKDYAFKGKLKPYLERHGFCMLTRSIYAFKSLIDDYANSSESKMYYSMWDGYLHQNKPAFNDTLYNFIKPYNSMIEHKHTSGHSDVRTLKEVFETINPRQGIIPVHTDNPEKFQELFENHTIILLRDGEILNCV